MHVGQPKRTTVGEECSCEISWDFYFWKLIASMDYIINYFTFILPHKCTPKGKRYDLEN